jgi:hypothetical protein
MSKLISWYRTFNILSIDVSFGAICSALFFASLLEVDIRPAGLACLGLTVWIIYTIDHLMDARRIGHTASSERHRYHQQHFSTLSSAVVLAVFLDACLLFFMKEKVVLAGFYLAGLVITYLLLNRYLYALKEFFVALIFTCGVALPSYAVTTIKLDVIHYVHFITFFFVALLNLLIFSYFDLEHDKRDRLPSLITAHEEIGKQAIGAISLCILFTCITEVFMNVHSIHTLLIFLMTIFLALIFVFRSAFVSNNSYRLIGDGIFMLPIIVVL